MYLPSVVAVSIYFESKRALATGICVCGSGIGTFVLAPVSELLLNEYNWSWALLILGAIILNGVVFGGLVRPLELIPSTKIITQENGDASKGKKKKSVEDSKELVPLITVTDDKEETTVMFKNAAKDTSKINPAEPVDTDTPLNVKVIIFYFTCYLSFLDTDLLHVCSGLPAFLLPCWFQSRTCFWQCFSAAHLLIHSLSCCF